MPVCLCVRVCAYTEIHKVQRHLRMNVNVRTSNIATNNSHSLYSIGCVYLPHVTHLASCVAPSLPLAAPLPFQAQLEWIQVQTRELRSHINYICTDLIARGIYRIHITKFNICNIIALFPVLFQSIFTVLSTVETIRNLYCFYINLILTEFITWYKKLFHKYMYWIICIIYFPRTYFFLARNFAKQLYREVFWGRSISHDNNICKFIGTGERGRCRRGRLHWVHMFLVSVSGRGVN